MEYTPEQLKVIELRDRNILVSAAAGSGKTAVLVERIIRLITDEDHPVDIDTLLVVTFTRAAAAQMKEKINNAILACLEKDPSNARLQRQAALVHNAHITTIDSFCQYVLQNSLTEGESDLSFRIAEEGENKLLEADVLDRLMEQLYTEADDEFLYMVEHMATDADDSMVAEAIHGLYDRSMSGPWPKKWLETHGKDYECPSGELPPAPYRWLMGQIIRTISGVRDSYKIALQAATEGGLNDKNVEIIKSEYNITEDIYTYINSTEAPDYEVIRGKVRNYTFDKFSSGKGSNEDPDMRVLVKKNRDLGKKLITDLRSNYLAQSYESLVRHTRNASGVVRCLCEVTGRYIDELDKAKKEKKILSFADCEHQALDILVKTDDEGNIIFTDAARQFRQFFSYVFIDEYQDSNLVQELILSAVSGEEDAVYNRFMVGDVKQSIYRFRQADPTIFTDKYLEYGYDDPYKCKIDLNRNFRSRRQVLDSANALFERIMTLSSGGSDYDESASLKCGADYPEGDEASYTTELIFAESKPVDDTLSSEEGDPARDAYADPSEEDPDIPQDDPSAAGMTRERIEGEVIAARIEQLMGEGFMVRDETDETKLRPVKYSDIVILYRAGLNYASAYKEALEAHGIPAHLTGSTGYFTTFEISTLMNLLRVLVNPLQDVYFYGTMEGLFGNFTPEEIACISAAYTRSLPAGVSAGEGYLYPACRYAVSIHDCGAGYSEDPVTQSDDGDDRQEPDSLVSRQLADRIRIFLDMIAEYRSMSQIMSVEKLLVKILEDTDYTALISAMNGGDRREANVSMLLRKASDYGNTSYFGLYNFIRYIDNLKKSDAMDAEAEIVDEGADVVRIMTTHKSKGLEFPVCIIARLGNKFNMSDANGRCISDYEAGIGVRDTDTVKRLSYETLYRKFVADIIRSKTLAEEMRILYVAMTRAKEKLIMVCTGAGSRNEEEDTLVIKRPKTIDHYIDWYICCMCDELDSDSITAGSGPVYIPSLHISYKKADLKDILSKEEIVSRGAETALKLKLLRDSVELIPEDDAYLNYLKQLVMFKYPHPDLTGLYTKTSVSDIKHAAMPDEDEAVFEMFEKKVAVPAFISGNYDRSGATVRGSAFHRVMELMDYLGLHNILNNGGNTEPAAGLGIRDTGILYDYINSSLDGFLADHGITQYERDIFKNKQDMDRLCAFFHDETSLRMTEAACRHVLYREAPFIMGLGADEVSPSYPHDETVLIQGIIDAYWIEDDGAVILDYKTDRVYSPDRLVSLYKTQLDLYERALVQMRIPVKEKLIYSFELGLTITL